MRPQQRPQNAASHLPPAQVDPPPPKPTPTGKTTLFDRHFDLATVIQFQDALAQLHQTQQSHPALQRELATTRQELAHAHHRVDELTENQSRSRATLRTLQARYQHQAELWQELAQAHQHLVQEHRQLTRFMQQIVHDLKPPLRGIHSLTRWITEDHPEQLDASLRDQIHLLHACTEKLQPLIEAIEHHPKSAPPATPTAT